MEFQAESGWTNFFAQSKQVIRLSTSDIKTRLYWGGRLIFNLPPKLPSEMLFRLSVANNISKRGSGTFRFPWGWMEYLELGSLCSQYRDIFVRQQYGFDSKSQQPVIVDCGANIGLSVVWFKQHYPHASITAYEADPIIAEVLKRNVEKLNLQEVNLVNAAVWHAATKVGFRRSMPVAGIVDEKAEFKVAAVRLSDELPEYVSLLKLDVEGAEFCVISDLCRSGAIKRIEKIIAECHVTPNHCTEFVGLLTELSENGMTITVGSAHSRRELNGYSHSAPFGAVDGEQFLIQIYAWR